MQSFHQTPKKVSFICQLSLKVEPEKVRDLTEEHDEGYRTPYFVPNEPKIETFG